MRAGRKLYRNRDDRMLGGVCAGLSGHFGMDPRLVRLAFVTMAFIFGVWPFVAVYLIAAVVVPEEPKGQAEEPPAPPQPPAPPEPAMP
ncbi:MAG: PspC domain-containing protein [Coriobacteriia bacterium]|nr:PspC domain-containing protein [Coriobacteriia bacterium]